MSSWRLRAKSYLFILIISAKLATDVMNIEPYNQPTLDILLLGNLAQASSKMMIGTLACSLLTPSFVPQPQTYPASVKYHALL